MMLFVVESNNYQKEVVCAQNQHGALGSALADCPVFLGFPGNYPSTHFKARSAFGSALGVFGGHMCDEKQAVRCASPLLSQTQLGFAVTMLAKIL